MIKVNSITYKTIKSDYARGTADINTGEIFIDKRLKGHELLEILIHEILHIQNPTWSEAKIIGHSQELAGILWTQGFRKVDL